MSSILGIDTSNYTTSAAIYHLTSGRVYHKRTLLPVKEGSLGLRQNEAVFHHNKQLPEILESLLDKPILPLKAVGVSTRPRDIKGSYMPCFLVGESIARAIAVSQDIPLYEFSHQAGHIAAALYSAGRLDMMDKPFFAFHVSGGTTEAVLVKPDKDKIFTTEIVAKTLDLNAGQAIDRVGAMLSLPFPSGPYIEELALKCNQSIKTKASMKEENCSLSGLENKCKELLYKGESHSYIARFLLESISQTIIAMTEKITEKFGNYPIVYAGGVMSNGIMRGKISEKFNAVFAKSEFSTDNAVGIAILTKLRADMK